MTTHRGGRPATGTVKWRKNRAGKEQWHVRLSLPGNKRSPWIALDPAIEHGTCCDVKTPKCEHRLQAEAGALEVARAGAVPVNVETMGEYAERWCAWRESSGFGCADDDRGILQRHVLPYIGTLDVRIIARDDLKRLVSELDDKARRGYSADGKGGTRSFGWKTAINAWVVVRALFRDARGAKRVDLCVREDNPADGVAGPDTGTKKAKVYVWPNEFLELVSCEKVPRRWRRLFALAVYTYMRAGELAALEWSDVDLTHGIIHVHRSLDDRRRGEISSTKSDTARRIPIEPALMPLLLAMHQEARGKGRVMRMPGDGASAKLRSCLRRAGVTRADLFVSDATRKAMTFHDLRATGITWCAVRGDDGLKIKQRAGHAAFSTTELYLREAENLSHGFGTPFPELPESLLGPGGCFDKESDSGTLPMTIQPKTSGSQWPLRDLNADGETAPDPAKQATSSTDAQAHLSESSHVSGTAVHGRALSEHVSTEPTDAVLERAIVDAVTMGLADVAKTLAGRLEERRRASMGNVVALRRR